MKLREHRRRIKVCIAMKYASAILGFAGVCLYAAAENYIGNTGIQTNWPIFATGVIFIGVVGTLGFGIRELLLRERYKKHKKTLKMRSELRTRKSA